MFLVGKTVYFSSFFPSLSVIDSEFLENSHVNSAGGFAEVLHKIMMSLLICASNFPFDMILGDTKMRKTIQIY